MAKGDFVIL